MTTLFLVLILCYLLGSIPTAVWTGKLVYGMDIRTQGSGNAGATNTFRVLGKKAGLFVLIFDISKGFGAASWVFFLLDSGRIEPDERVLYQLIFGLAAVSGHIYPVFAGFKGGKGVATLLGMVFSISWVAGLLCAGLFLILLQTWHYVSVGSMAGGIAFSILLISGFCGPVALPAQILSVFLSLFVVYTHRGNIRKLLAGTENKMYLLKPKP